MKKPKTTKNILSAINQAFLFQKKKIDTLGKVLVVCLSRNTGSRKDETAINPDKNLSLRNDKQSCVIDYKLNSVIVHLGNHRAGH